MTPAEAASTGIAGQGAIRIAINTGNAATVSVAADGTLGGASVALAHRLGEALGLPIALLRFASARAIVEAEQAGDAWDVAFLAIDPARGERLHFSPPYLSIEATYAVPIASTAQDPDELDRPGVRIASCAGAAYDLHLQRSLRAASLVRHDGPDAANAAFRAGGFAAVAGLRAGLARAFADDPAVRILADGFLTIQQAIAVPKRKRHAAALVDGFVRTLAAVPVHPAAFPGGDIPKPDGKA